jgi:hypothetical protein
MLLNVLWHTDDYLEVGDWAESATTGTPCSDRRAGVSSL